MLIYGCGRGTSSGDGLRGGFHRRDVKLHHFLMVYYMMSRAHDFLHGFCMLLFSHSITIFAKMRDRRIQRHVPCLPACRCILGIHKGLDTAKIFRKQVGILAQI